MAAVVPPAQQVVDNALELYRWVTGIFDNSKNLPNRLFARGREEPCWVLYTDVSQHIVNKKLVVH